MSIEGLRASQEAAHDVLAAVPKDQLDAPTPCSDWNLGQLIDHLVGTQAFMLSASGGEPPEGAGTGASRGDFVAVFDDLSAKVASALSAPGFAERKLDLPFGTFTGAQFVQFASLETLVHAWDVARALGRSTDLAPATAEGLLQVARAGVHDSMRGPQANFGPELDPPAGASPADRLAAFLGRNAG